MICRTCLRQAARPLACLQLPRVASFSTTLRTRNAAAAAAAEQPPKLTPLTPDAPAGADATNTAPLSSCVAGTKLNGLNYFKDKQDPVALPDEAYPAWLWNCLEVQKKASDAADADAGDEFSKSKKTRRLAAKRKSALEAKMLATGNLEALVPKIPLQKQSINLPEGEKGVEGAVRAVKEREDLRRALRKERKAGIKESNYLKTM